MSVTIRTNAIAANYQRLNSQVSGELIAVIKADAYGHGALPTYKALANDCELFAVANVVEGVGLRNDGATKRILILSDCSVEDDWKKAISMGLEPVIYCEAQLEYLSNGEKPRTVWIKFDSGMHRAGLSASKCRKAVQLCRDNGINIAALMSHLASSEESSADGLTEDQCQKSEALASELSLALSLGNSAACWRFGKKWQHQYFRAGISLFGMSPFSDKIGPDLGLSRSMTVNSTISAIKEIKKGAGVGYNRSWIATKASRIALIPFGYADGYPRLLSSDNGKTRGEVYIPTIRQNAPLVGRVSMDLITIDVTSLAVKVGDKVELWGENLALEQLAMAAQTISYEILTHSVLARRRGVQYG